MVCMWSISSITVRERGSYLSWNNYTRVTCAVPQSHPNIDEFTPNFLEAFSRELLAILLLTQLAPYLIRFVPSLRSRNAMVHLRKSSALESLGSKRGDVYVKAPEHNNRSYRVSDVHLPRRGTWCRSGTMLDLSVPYSTSLHASYAMIEGSPIQPQEVLNHSCTWDLDLDT